MIADKIAKALQDNLRPAHPDSARRGEILGIPDAVDALVVLMKQAEDAAYLEGWKAAASMMDPSRLARLGLVDINSSLG